MLQSFTKFVASKHDFERALADGEVAEDEKEPEPCFKLVTTLCKSKRTAEGDYPGAFFVSKFLEQLFESKEQDLEQYMPLWINKLLEAQPMYNNDIMHGINQFLTVIADLESDVPLIAKWFTSYFLFPLFDKKANDLNA